MTAFVHEPHSVSNVKKLCVEFSSLITSKQPNARAQNRSRQQVKLTLFHQGAISAIEAHVLRQLEVALYK